MLALKFSLWLGEMELTNVVLQDLTPMTPLLWEQLGCR